jgi:(p)ppGpp synthase/HD superfamily hydrolase
MELFTHWHTWADAEPGLRERLPASVVADIAAAARFAALHHGAQRRPTGTPYLDHLMEALEVLVLGAGVLDPDILIAAVLHDVVEDTSCTLEEIAGAFGGKVAGLVGWVTIPPTAPGEDRRAVKEAYLRRLRGAPRDAILVKLADRVSNVQTLRNLEPARQRSYYAQTVTHIIPLAAGEPWFAAWYGQWRHELADLGAPG